MLMFDPGDSGSSPPTAVDYIFHGLFALFFLWISACLVIALFNDRYRAHAGFRWGKGRGATPMSRFGIVMALPFTLFIPVSCVMAIPAALAGKEPGWFIPYWWFFPCGILCLVGSVYDGLRENHRRGISLWPSANKEQ